MKFKDSSKMFPKFLTESVETILTPSSLSHDKSLDVGGSYIELFEKVRKECSVNSRKLSSTTMEGHGTETVA